MINKCVVCDNEFEAVRKAKRTCSDACRQKLARGKATVTEIIPIVTEKKSTVTDTVTKKVIVTEVKRAGEKVLKFTEDIPMDKRIEMFYELYPQATFIPNWIAHGFASKEEAIKEVLKSVRKTTSIERLGLGMD